jgi:hypothetical protein
LKHLPSAFVAVLHFLQLVVSGFVEQWRGGILKIQLALAQSWSQIVVCDFSCLVVKAHCTQQEVLFLNNLPLLLSVVSVISFSPFQFNSAFSLCTLPFEVCSLWLWIDFPRVA